jgi:putative thioredoxin
VLANVAYNTEQMIDAQFGLHSIPGCIYSKTVSRSLATKARNQKRSFSNFIAFLPKKRGSKTGAQVTALLAEIQYAEAQPLLKDAWQSSQKSSDIDLTLAKTTSLSAILKTLNRFPLSPYCKIMIPIIIA